MRFWRKKHNRPKEPIIFKTSVNGKPYIPRGKEREEMLTSRRGFILKAAKGGALLGAGAALASVGMPVSGVPPVNWNMGPGGQEASYDWLFFKGGSSWYRKRGDTGAVDDSSEADSPTTDPNPLMNRLLVTVAASYSPSSTTYRTPRIIVNGDCSSATTLLFTSPIVYAHYGVFKYTGTGDAVLFNIPQSDISSVQGGSSVDSYGKYYWEALIGPNISSPYNSSASAFGIHAIILVRAQVEVGMIQFFTEGIRLDMSGTNYVLGDVRFRVKVFACYEGMHFYVGAGSGIQIQGVVSDVVIGQCSNHGVLIDNHSSNCFNTFFGTVDNLGATGGAAQDYTSNQTGTNSGNLLLFHFMRMVASTVWQNDVMFSSYSNNGVTIPTFGLQPTTGAQTATLGTNGPMITTTPYKWMKFVMQDRSIVYMPVWK